MAKILIVEDDMLLNKGVAFALKKDNHEVISAYSKAEGRQCLLKEKVDFILLDVNLPDGNGMDFCREVKEKANIPVVFFTANDTEEDMVRGFETGCDDYIAKPFSTEVLKHKINAILKRNSVLNKNIFEYDDLKIDFDKMTVEILDRNINLTGTEYKILELLAINKGKVLTKEVLLEKVWDSNGNFVNENTLSVNIKRLRNKIEADPKNPKYIVTVFGIGYTLGE